MNGQLISSSIKQKQGNFKDISVSNYAILSKTLKRRLVLYEVILKIDINAFNIVLYLQKDKNEKGLLWIVQTWNTSNLYTIYLNPYVETKDVEKNIFSDLANEEEKQELFICFVNYLNQNELPWKKKFLKFFWKIFPNFIFDENEW